MLKNAVDLITVDDSNEEVERECKYRLEELVGKYDATDQALVTHIDPERDMKHHNQSLYVTGEGKECKKNKLSSKRISYAFQTLVLFHRLFKNTIRNKTLVLGKVGEALLMGVVVGLIFFQLSTSSIVDIQSSISAVYTATSMQPYLILLAVTLQGFSPSSLSLYSTLCFPSSLLPSPPLPSPSSLSPPSFLLPSPPLPSPCFLSSLLCFPLSSCPFHPPLPLPPSPHLISPTFWAPSPFSYFLFLLSLLSLFSLEVSLSSCFSSFFSLLPLLYVPSQCSCPFFLPLPPTFKLFPSPKRNSQNSFE